MRFASPSPAVSSWDCLCRALLDYPLRPDLLIGQIHLVSLQYISSLRAHSACPIKPTKNSFASLQILSGWIKIERKHVRTFLSTPNHLLPADFYQCRALSACHNHASCRCNDARTADSFLHESGIFKAELDSVSAEHNNA